MEHCSERCPVCNAKLVKEDWGMGLELYCPEKPKHFRRVKSFSNGTDNVYMEQTEKDA